MMVTNSVFLTCCLDVVLCRFADQILQLNGALPASGYPTAGSLLAVYLRRISSQVPNFSLKVQQVANNKS